MARFLSAGEIAWYPLGHAIVNEKNREEGTWIRGCHAALETARWA
jgi:hypothetical protein